MPRVHRPPSDSRQRFEAAIRGGWHRVDHPLASRRPETYLPGASIEAVRYRGREQDTFTQTDARRITGPLDQQIRDAMAFFRRNMTVAATKDPARQDHPQFSEAAAFEAIVNAVAHRDDSIGQSSGVPLSHLRRSPKLPAAQPLQRVDRAVASPAAHCCGAIRSSSFEVARLWNPEGILYQSPG